MLFARAVVLGTLLFAAACSAPHQRLEYDHPASPRVNSPEPVRPAQPSRRWPAYSVDEYGKVLC